jgi:hypothetical protein
MTKLLHDSLKLKNKKILNNYYLNFGNKIKLTQLFQMQIKNTALGVDEAYLLLEARLSPTNIINRLTSYFFFQSRKLDNDIFLTAQIGGTLDIRARLISHYIINCIAYRTLFSYELYNKSGKLINEFELKRKDALKYYKMFDTKEIITPYYYDSQINFKEVKTIFKDAPTKKSFVTIIKKINPQLSLDDISASYDFLKIKKIGFAKSSRYFIAVLPVLYVIV